MDRIDELLVGITWTHKIHEKQADIFEGRSRCLSVASLLLVSLTASGIVGVLFSDTHLLKVITAAFSLVSVFVSLLSKTVDYQARAQEQRQAAKAFLCLREDARNVLCKARAGAIDLEALATTLDDLSSRYKEACLGAPSTTDWAVCKARRSLDLGESTMTECEKESFVPKYGRGAR